MKIIFIDPDETKFEILKEVASLSQSEVIRFDTVKDAKEYIKYNKDIHGIIAAEKVSDGTTLAILAIMKKDPTLDSIPFVMISENPTQEEIEYYKTLGVAEVFETPFNPLEIFLTITNYIKDTKGEETVKSILTEDKKERSLIEKIIAFIKRIFGKD